MDRIDIMKKDNKVVMRSKDELTGTLIEKELTYSNGTEVDNALQELMFKRNCNKIETEFYQWHNVLQEWVLDQKKTYYEPNNHPEFVLLCNGDHEWRYRHTRMQEMIMHLPSKTIFFVDEREFAKYSDETAGSIFYKFRYEINEKTYRFITYCPYDHDSNEQEKERIKQEILIPGSKWYCEHIREKWKHDMGMDFYSVGERKLKELNK